MACTKIIVALCLVAVSMAVETTKNEAKDLETDSSIGLGYAYPHLGYAGYAGYGGLGYAKFAYPGLGYTAGFPGYGGYYGGYGHGFGYPGFGYTKSFYGAYPYAGFGYYG